MKIFNLPDLGEGLAEAEIHEWYIKEGDAIAVDQPMVAMETAKAIVDVPSPYAGKIGKCHGAPGDIIKTGMPLVSFITEDKVTVVGNLETSEIIITESSTSTTSSANQANKTKALPAVRNLAKQLKVDINHVQGTGKKGAITTEDVLLAANVNKTSANKTTANFAGEDLHGVRRAMAITLAKSHAEVVPVTIYDDADIHAWKSADITSRIVRALIVACRAEPSLNAWFDGKTLQRQLHKPINLGLAMDSPDGLFVPVIQQADKLSASELREQIEQYKKEIDARNVTPANLQQATIVLSNFGMFAGRYASPIVVPPTVAILATGKIRYDVVAHQNQPTVHRIIPLSLTFDHRAATGGEATRFMGAVIKDLELPE